MKHAPRGFVGHACFALDLFGGNSAARGTHEVHSVKPDAELSAGFLEDRSCQREDVIAAGLASVGSAAPDAVVFTRLFALLAIGYAAGKSLLFDLLKTGIIGRKIGLKLLKRIAKFLGYGLTAIHGSTTMPSVRLGVKG